MLTFIAPPNYEAPADDDTDNEYVVIVQAPMAPRRYAERHRHRHRRKRRAAVPQHREWQTERGENTQAGENIGAPIAATDPERDQLTYTMTGDDPASFDIDQSSGQLRTKAALNHETKDGYYFTVLVSDAWMPTAILTRLRMPPSL